MGLCFNISYRYFYKTVVFVPVKKVTGNHSPHCFSEQQ